MASKYGMIVSNKRSIYPFACTSKMQLTTEPTPPQVLTSENLLNTLKIMKQDLILEFNQKITEIENKMQEALKNMEKQLRMDMLEVCKGLATNVDFLEDCIETNKQALATSEEYINKFKKDIANFETEVLMSQFRRTQFAIRVRGLKEGLYDDLKGRMIEALVQVSGISKDELATQIEKIYRVNSWHAKQKHLPRDIVIYFTTRVLRNRIIQATFKNNLQVNGQELKIWKEIPYKMLKARKEFTFLIDELKRLNLQYKWEAPTGVTVKFMEKRYRLNTISKATEFYINTLKADTSKIPEEKRMNVEEDKEEKSFSLDQNQIILKTQSELQSQKDVKKEMEYWDQKEEELINSKSSRYKRRQPIRYKEK